MTTFGCCSEHALLAMSSVHVERVTHTRLPPSAASAMIVTEADMSIPACPGMIALGGLILAVLCIHGGGPKTVTPKSIVEFIGGPLPVDVHSAE